MLRRRPLSPDQFWFSVCDDKGDGITAQTSGWTGSGQWVTVSKMFVSKQTGFGRFFGDASTHLATVRLGSAVYDFSAILLYTAGGVARIHD